VKKLISVNNRFTEIIMSFIVNCANYEGLKGSEFIKNKYLNAVSIFYLGITMDDPRKPEESATELVRSRSRTET